MTHGIDTRQRVVHRRRIAYVAGHEAGHDVIGLAGMNGGGEGVQAPHLVARRPQCLRDVRPDEAGRAGDKNAHGWMQPCASAR
jgi:hypothetical protein